MSTPQESKGDARDARLSIRKTNEEVMRRHFQQIARQQCNDESTAFGQCAEKEGLWVVWKCREQSKAMNACMDKYYNEALFQEHLKQVIASKETAPK